MNHAIRPSKTDFPETFAVGFDKPAEKVTTSDEKAIFTALYESHQGLVRSVIFNIAGAENLDDLVQEAFVKVWRGLGGFREESQLKTWIYRVSANVALDHCRKNKRRFDPTQLDPSSRREQFLNHAPQPALVETRELVAKGLMQLSAEHRTVLVLAYLEDLPLQDVSDILDISLGTVKSRLHYAKIEFREFLKRSGIQAAGESL